MVLGALVSAKMELQGKPDNGMPISLGKKVSHAIGDYKYGKLSGQYMPLRE